MDPHEMLAHLRANWESELEDGLAHAKRCRLDSDETLSLAVTLSLMRGMQDTIDELRSRLTAVEKKR